MNLSDIQFGPPETSVSRLPREMRCYDLLSRLAIDYLRVDHDPAMTMADCIEIDAALGSAMCKNLFLCNHQKTAYYLLLMPGDKPFRTAEVSKLIASSRLSFGSGEDMERLLDISPGSLSLLGLMNDTDNKVRLLVDRALLQNEFIGIHPCVNTTSLRLRTSDAFGRLIEGMGHDMTLLTLSGAKEERP